MLRESWTPKMGEIQDGRWSLSRKLSHGCPLITLSPSAGGETMVHGLKRERVLPMVGVLSQWPG